MTILKSFAAARSLAAVAGCTLLTASIGATATEEKELNGRIFVPISTFDIMAGNGSAVAEIVDVNHSGNRLIYTDSDNSAIGFVAIGDPANPMGLGTVDVGGEPTSLVVRNPWVLVAVNTSNDDFVNPSGKLVVLNIGTRAIVAEHDLGGQPDSIAVAPDGNRAVVVIENERNEDLNDGLLPQAPTGKVLIVSIQGAPSGWPITEADLAPVAANAKDGSDLEPEYVDINAENEAVVTFQENNHLAVIDIETGSVLNDFSAGEVELWDVDTAEEDLITLNTDITKRREPDAVTWIDNDRFATANEGDFEDESGEEGGSRGFTIFNQNGTVEYESYESFEHVLVSAGHYNEGRSENKGVEPEAVEFGQFREQATLFVASERSNAVGVYSYDGSGVNLEQVLPTGIGPEGLKAIPSRRLFVASTESSEEDAGIPTMINIYRLQGGETYPTIASGLDADGLPIPWVALSGLVGDPVDSNTLYAVSDSFLAEGFIYTIDVSASTPTIVSRLQVTGASSSLDLEGVAVGPDGYFWLGSEGRTGTRPNAVLKVNPKTGAVVREIFLPADLVDMQRNNGIEGIAVTGTPGSETVYVAIQRAWPNEGDTDQVNTKIGRYSVASGEWGFVHYPLEPQGNGDWIGLSDLTLLPNGKFAVIERDKGWGPSTPPNAELKALFEVDLANANFLPSGGPLFTIRKSLMYDVLPDLEARSIWTAEKLEGFAVAADGQTYAVTDNDGVDDAPGETIFLRLGPIDELQ